jgi:hypothetical protein
MAEEQARLQEEDPDRGRRIRERLRDVMSLLRPRQFRRQKDGAVRAGGPNTTGPDGSGGTAIVRPIGEGGHRQDQHTRGIGSVLSQVQPDGEEAGEVYSILQLEPKWVTEQEAESFAIVSGNGKGFTTEPPRSQARTGRLPTSFCSTATSGATRRSSVRSMTGPTRTGR